MGEEKSQQSGSTYRAVFDRSVRQPSDFWLEQADLLDWHIARTRGRDYDGAAAWKWYREGHETIGAQSLDRGLKNGRAEQPAVIWDSAMTDQKVTYTYAELLDQVARLAAA